jgi:hypothetical protein
MIKRNTPFSDIKVNNFPAHRVVLVAASETFRNMIGDLSEDVCELALPYPDALVDQLLDLVYYKKYNLTSDLYKLVLYMNIKSFTITQEIINELPGDELYNMLSKFDIEYEPNLDAQTNADYRFLCCLPHEKFMSRINSAMDDLYNRDVRPNDKKTQLYYTVVTLRCLIPWYENYRLAYVVYQHSIGRVTGLTGLLSKLVHDHKITKYSILGCISKNPEKKNIDLTNFCVKVLKSLNIKLPEGF